MLISVCVLVFAKVDCPKPVLALACFLLATVATRVEFRLTDYDSAEQDRFCTGMSYVAGGMAGLFMLAPKWGCLVVASRMALPSVSTLAGLILFGLPNMNSGALWAAILIPIVILTILCLSRVVRLDYPVLGVIALVFLYGSFAYIFTAALRYLSLSLQYPELVVGAHFIDPEWIGLTVSLFFLRVVFYLRPPAACVDYYTPLPGDADAAQ